MDRVKFGILVLGILVLITEVAFSNTSTESTAIPRCPVMAELQASAQVTRIHLDHLPSMLLVGREAKIWVKQGSSEIRAEQNFLRPANRVLCASSSGTESAEFNMSAPVLLDLSGNSKAENSVWNFQLMMNGQKVGVWNQASKLLSKDFDLKKLQQEGIQVAVEQISHDQFELTFTKALKDSGVERVSIVYDAVTSAD